MGTYYFLPFDIIYNKYKNNLCYVLNLKTLDIISSFHKPIRNKYPHICFFGILKTYIINIYGFYFEEYMLGYLQASGFARGR